jgi:hypothetical protein
MSGLLDTIGVFGSGGHHGGFKSNQNGTKVWHYD